MGNLRALMLDKRFDSLSLADQTDVMRQAGAPDELLSEWVSRKATGPTISATTGPSPVGFEDTSADAAAVLGRNVEPNRARDVLPKLAMFAAEGALAGVPAGVAGAVSKGVQSLRGLSTGAKVAKIATGGAKLGAEGLGYWAADRVLATAGVPPEYRAVALAAAGYAAHADRARKAVGGAAEAVAAPVADEAKAAAIAASRARREAAAAETVAKAHAPVAAPVEPPPPTVAAAPTPAAPYPTGPTPEYTAMIQRDLAERRARFAQADQLRAAERTALEPQFIADDAVSVVPPHEVPMVPDDAVALMADPIPPRVRRQPVQGIVLQPPAPRGAPAAPPQAAPVATRQAKGTTTMATNLGGKAKPGPPPTPPDKIEEALRASIKEVAEESALKAPRVAVGAERVGKGVGLTKEEVRLQTGPIVGEASGAASPVFPQNTFDQIWDKMQAMPRGGVERKAYAAAAKDPKAMTQVETMRRAMEKMGYVVPVAAIVEAIRRKESGPASGLSLGQLMQMEQ